MLDYIYLPMGGNKGTKVHYVLLMLFIFSFSGLWHGANLTFICWGLLNGIYFLPYILTDTLTRYNDPPAKGRMLPGLKEALQIFLTFNLITISRVFFRSPDIFVVKDFFLKICSASFFEAPLPIAVKNIAWCLPMLIVEWIQREKKYVLDMQEKNISIRIIVYLAVATAIYFLYKKQNTAEYYYFKF
jgi:alginate O-acetyltransferase complex protein AlgI